MRDLSEILQKQILKLTTHNKVITRIQKHFRDCIDKILNNSNNNNIQQTNIKDYQDILLENGINVSIEVVEMFILGQNIYEFKEFININGIKNLIISFSLKDKPIDLKDEMICGYDEGMSYDKEYDNNPNQYNNPEKLKPFFGKDGIYRVKDDFNDILHSDLFRNFINLIDKGELENLKLFFGKDGLIKNKEEFVKILRSSSWKELIHIIEHRRPKIVRLFFGMNGIITKVEDLENLINNPYWSRFISLVEYYNEENLELFFGEKGIIKNIRDMTTFLNISLIDEIFMIIREGALGNLQIFFGKNGIINSLTGLIELVLINNKEDQGIFNLLKYGNAENIEIYLGKNFCNITNVDELEKFINKLTDIERNIFRKDFELLIQTKVENNLKQITGLKILVYNGEQGDCPHCEVINRRIIKEKLLDKITILNFNGTIIGYIKNTGAKTFLAIDNFVDENGNILFVKGGIYSIEGYEKIIGTIDNSNRIHNIGSDGLTINFLRRSYLSKEEIDEIINFC